MDLDWKNLSFGYIKTDYNIRSYFRDGAWTTPELTTDETVTMLSKDRKHFAAPTA